MQTNSLAPRFDLHSPRISSLDFIRTPAIIAVILIHTHPLKNAAAGISQLVEVAINQGARFAVPLFFILSGYFFARKAISSNNPWSLLWAYIRRLGTIFLFWSLVYFFVHADIGLYAKYSYVDILQLKWEVIKSHPLTIVFQGTKVHLWYLVSLLLALLLLTMLISLKAQAYIILGGVILYVVGLLGGAYSVTPFGFDFGFNTRNGPFLSFMCVALGWYLAQSHRHFATPYIIILLVTAITLQYSEIYCLYHYYDSVPTSHDFLASTLLVSFALVLLLLQYPDFGHNKTFSQIGQYALGIYVMHFLFVDLLQSLAPYIPGIAWDIIYPLLVYVVTLGCVMVLSKIPGVKKVVK